jgi:YesN/AraC family two-component response regulator
LQVGRVISRDTRDRPVGVRAHLSGYGDNEEAQSMISLGAQGLLGKPFRMSDLAAHLSRLGRRQA